MKVLIFNPFGIGDVLFTTPLVRNLKENFPQVSISYLCNRRVFPLMKNNQSLDKVFVFEKDEWRTLARESKFKFLRQLVGFYRTIRRERFDILFDLSLNSQYGFFFKMAGIKKRIGLNYKNRGRFLTDKLDLPGGYKDKHVARYYLDLIRLLDCEPKDYRFDLTIMGKLKEEEPARNTLLIGICPGSGDSWQDTAYFKRWPKENFIALGQRIRDELGAKVILFGSSAESAICEEIAGKLDGALNLCGKISLEEFCLWVGRCNILVTNDGGPFHIAQALGKKALVFFGPVDERIYGAYPDNEGVAVLTSNVSCRPCYQRFRFPGCTADKQCLRQIEVSQAYSAIKDLLG